MIKKIFLLFLFIPTLVFAQSIEYTNPPLEITEPDGSPSIYPWRVVVPNGSLTDDATGATIALLTPATAATTYVPYTGASGDVDLGIYSLKATSVTIQNGALQFNAGEWLWKNVTGTIDYYSFYSEAIGIISMNAPGVTANAYLNINNLLTVDRTFTFPDASGTLALTGAGVSQNWLTTGTLGAGAGTFTGLTVNGASTLGNGTDVTTINDVLRLTGLTSDPVSLSNGDIWYRSDLNQIRVRLNSKTFEIALKGV